METEVRPAVGLEPEPPEWDSMELFLRHGGWTEEAYLDLPSNRRVELTDGCLELLPMPTEEHQLLLVELFRVISELVRERSAGMVLPAGIPVRLWEGKFREPDIAFLKRENYDRRRGKYWEGADLVVEIVSGGGRGRDLKTKPEEYAWAGIPEYWIVDPQQSCITVLTLAQGSSAFVVGGEYGPGEVAASVILPGLTVNVSGLFAAAEL